MKKASIITLVAMAILSIALSSCSSDFSDGFREGWNSTAPEQYRY